MVTTPHTRLPRLVEGIDLRQLPIGPAEAFVLSHVDGTTSESEIADEAGIEPARVAATLEELARLGAISFEQPAPSDPDRSARVQHRVSGSMRIGPIIEASGRSEPQHPAAALYDPRELDEDAEIELERKRVILEAYYRLDSVTHYQLLRVDPSADKRAIKNAYFEIVNIFHPDRYFGKKLGSFKPKLERVFARITEAHDALTRLGPRAEYDAYLASLDKTRPLDHADAAVQAQVQAIQRQIEAEARAAIHEPLIASAAGVSIAPPGVSIAPPGVSVAPPGVSIAPPGVSIVPPGVSIVPPGVSIVPPGVSSAPPGVSIVPPGVSSAPPAGTSTSPPGVSFSPPASPSMWPSGSQPRLPSQRPLDADARKRALARKLGGRNMSGSMPSVQSSSPPSPQRLEAQERAAEDLKRRYDQRVTHARVAQAERYLVNARQSLRSRDPISAANALRIAASLVPDNPEIMTRLQEAQLEAEALLSGHYLTQAQYEERDGKLVEAARSYARATLGSPDAHTFERAAYCALLAEGDLRVAGEFARRAVALAPEDVQTRVTLARIYVTAGMKQSGLAEFERAATLAPKDDTIRDWIRRLKRGEA